MFNSVFRDILPTLTSPNAGFLPTPPKGITFRRRCANSYTGYFIINDTGCPDPPEQYKAMQRGLGGSPHERLHQDKV
ncbi:MAG: hypothetical protein F6K63_25900 [Moorea sp. SIO1G6]|uniref:hypothetical protein n=1 Tax=Moorena sp. SIO1G6 TaxID=2607840 RepID=UPI0013BF2F6F|nr:hypothetical protein [Moorena sp. SIO1G6]NET67630.1 hypothetical protein [Moorena sp. SIO1G6]